MVGSCKYKMNGGFLTKRYFLVYKLSHLASTFLRPSSPKCIENKSATAVAAISCWPGAGLGDKLFLQDILGFCRCGFVQQPAQSRHPASRPTIANNQQPATADNDNRPTKQLTTSNRQPAGVVHCSLVQQSGNFAWLQGRGQPASKLTDKPATSEIFGCLLPAARCKWVTQVPKTERQITYK